MLQVSLLYFGLKFLRLDVPARVITESLKITDDINWPGWDTFREVVATDMRRLNKARIGAKTKEERKHFELWETDGEFIPLPSEHGVIINKYVYHHSFHTPCSSIGLKQLRDAGVPITIQDIPSKKCSSHPRKDHDLLQPYFCDDYGLEALYHERIDDNLPEINHYRSCLCSVQVNKACGYFFDENDWTE